ncbi:hypothetical protein Tco_1533067 [Tanacetum coccineum]
MRPLASQWGPNQGIKDEGTSVVPTSSSSKMINFECPNGHKLLIVIYISINKLTNRPMICVQLLYAESEDGNGGLNLALQSNKASMLDEAIEYLKPLKMQVQLKSMRDATWFPSRHVDAESNCLCCSSRCSVWSRAFCSRIQHVTRCRCGSSRRKCSFAGGRKSLPNVFKDRNCRHPGMAMVIRDISKV